jgi:hypothetical protein
MQTELKQKQNVFKVDIVNDNSEPLNTDAPEDLTIDVPEHIQPSLDSVLDFYSSNGQKPLIKLSGNPLDIVSEFISEVEKTLPEALLNSGRDIIDFVINNLCRFSRDKSVNHISFNFSFNRKN